MSENSETTTTPRKVNIRPSMKTILHYFIAGALLLPVYGVGVLIIIAGVFVWNRKKYALSDEDISAQISGKHVQVYFRDVTKAGSEVRSQLPDFLDSWFPGARYETLVLETTSGRFEFEGIPDSNDIAAYLNNLITQREVREKASNEREQFRIKTDPGSLERLNDLVGLWQQGMISDEEYQKERSKFVGNH